MKALKSFLKNQKAKTWKIQMQKKRKYGQLAQIA